MLIKAEGDRLKHEHDGRAWQAWHTAALGRVKRMPKLEDLTRAKAKRFDPKALRSQLRAYQALKNAKDSFHGE